MDPNAVVLVVFERIILLKSFDPVTVFAIISVCKSTKSKDTGL